jgi:tetratricopeptide (TPR) repeat protein
VPPSADKPPAIVPEPAIAAAPQGTGAAGAAPTDADQPPALRTRQQPAAGDEFINLGDWLRDAEAPRSTRLVIEDDKPTGDEAADFADMLRKFKQGIAENVSDEDHNSHYDLGVAYKEMGLVDEAVAQFQKALRAPEGRVRTYEALGQCFIEKQQFQVAATILSRALNEPGVTDEVLVGVLYLLGYASEALNRWEAAVGYYQRVFAVDIRFRDTAQRLASIERASQ